MIPSFNNLSISVLAASLFTSGNRLGCILNGTASPVSSDSLDTLEGSSWFSSMDLSSGYYQVQMDPNHKEKTGSVWFGHQNRLGSPWSIGWFNDSII
jgi:hypothetical protein